MRSTTIEPWEYGSEFHWPSFGQEPSGQILPESAELFGSGRDALRALIAMGIRHRGWRRCFVPTYLCQEVVAAVAAAGIEVVLYEDSPLWPAPPEAATPFCRGDVFFLVNYFGLRGPQAARAVRLGPAELVEDHTHDPWSDWARTSRADFCLVSLRKTLPLPDGGALWSPRGHPLPAGTAITPERQSASFLKLGAMLLKRLYLDGRPVDKEGFRQLQVAGERRISLGEVSGSSKWVREILPVLPWETWRQKRARNYQVLCQALLPLPGIEPLLPFGDGSLCPFSLVLKCDTPRRRESLRTRLTADAIYPAILWPIHGTGGEEMPHKMGEAEKLSQRILSLPCDFRYEHDDLLRVAEAVEQALSDTVLS